MQLGHKTSEGCTSFVPTQEYMCLCEVRNGQPQYYTNFCC